jgi:hypothetical protein
MFWPRALALLAYLILVVAGSSVSAQTNTGEIMGVVRQVWPFADNADGTLP